MRAIMFIITLLVVSANANALEPIDDQQLMLYYHVPLGADTQQASHHQFGLRLDRTTRDPNKLINLEILDKKAAAMDFRMGYDGIQSLKINGIDYAATLIAKAKAGDDTADVSADETVADDSVSADETTAEAESEEQKPEEKGEFQKKLDELPAGVVIGVLLGIGILAGVGG